MAVGIGLGIAGVAGGLLSAFGSKSSANTQAQASVEAAKIQAAAANQAIAAQQQQFGQTQANLSPYLAQGYNAQNELSYLLGNNVGPDFGTPAGLAPNEAGILGQKGGLLAPYNAGQPFSFTGFQSGLNVAPSAPGTNNSPGYGTPGYGSPTVLGLGTGPGGVLQAPAPYQHPDFTFGVNQTGLPGTPGAPNSGQGYATAGANGVATYNAPSPYRPTPYNAPAPYQTPAPFNYTAADFHASPGYAYALQQAQQASKNQFAAGGGGKLSGNMLASLQSNAAGLANQDFNSQEQLAQQAYNMNANIGQNAYNMNANVGLNAYAENANVGQNAYNENAQIGQNAYTTNLGAAGSAYTQNAQNALNNYMTNLNTGLNVYGTNFQNASNTFNQGYNQNLQNQNQIFNFLNSQSGSGQNAAAQLGAFGQNNANQIGGLLTQGGAANASGVVGAANANAAGTANMFNAFGGIANQLGVSNYLSQNSNQNPNQSQFSPSPFSPIQSGISGGGDLANGGASSGYGTTQPFDLQQAFQPQYNQSFNQSGGF